MGGSSRALIPGICFVCVHAWAEVRLRLHRLANYSVNKLLRKKIRFRAGRGSTATKFYDLLVLKSKGAVEVKQPGPSRRISERRADREPPYESREFDDGQ